MYTLYDYIAQKNGDQADALLVREGFPRPRTIAQRIQFLKKYAQTDRYKALGYLAKIHPDYALIKDVLENTKKYEACGCMFAVNDIPIQENLAPSVTPQTTSITPTPEKTERKPLIDMSDKTNQLMLLGGAFLIAIALIVRK